jgi:hypothetical protein
MTSVGALPEAAERGLLLFDFLLLFFFDAISAVCTNSMFERHYFAWVQSLRQNIGYMWASVFTTVRSLPPERPASRWKPSLCASSSILVFSRST